MAAVGVVAEEPAILPWPGPANFDLAGVLSPRAAKTLIENLTRTKFVQFFGATESGLWALYHLDMDPEYREYLSIDACHMGLEWRPVDGGSELLSAVANGDPEAQTPHSTFYEPIFVRRKDPALASRQAIFQTFPDIDEYATGDLFTPHPIRPNTWKFAGRADDLILFGHGIKFHPAGIEAKIQRTHNEIQEVVMWGDGHQQAILLIELTDEGLAGMEDGRGESKVRSRLDILIDEVNVEAPVIAQIAKTHIIIATRGKSLPRTAKGSVRRREAAKLYRVEIDEVYRVYGDEMVRMMSRVQ
jgi:acyl-CoA synthetase (AMP-forming)/AMP-acid ligase II